MGVKKLFRNEKFRRRANSAQTIFLVLVIISAVMAIGLSFGLMNVHRLHTTSKVGESVRAYFAAESGVECEIYKETVDNSVDCDSSKHMTNGTSYTVSASTVGVLTIIDANGDSKEVYRAIEVKY